MGILKTPHLPLPSKKNSQVCFLAFSNVCLSYNVCALRDLSIYLHFVQVGNLFIFGQLRIHYYVTCLNNVDFHHQPQSWIFLNILHYVQIVSSSVSLLNKTCWVLVWDVPLETELLLLQVHLLVSCLVDTIKSEWELFHKQNWKWLVPMLVFPLVGVL